MPAYNTQPMPTPKPALYTGDQYALVNNAAVDSGILATQQVAIAPHQADSATYCTVFSRCSCYDLMRCAVGARPVCHGSYVRQSHHLPRIGFNVSFGRRCKGMGLSGAERFVIDTRKIYDPYP